MTAHLIKDSGSNVEFSKILKEATIVARQSDIFHSTIQITEENQLEYNNENYIDCSNDLY